MTCVAVFVYSSGDPRGRHTLQFADELSKEVDHDHCEEQAIDAIKDAAMPRYELTAIFDVRLAFDERFGEVAQRGRDTDEQAEQDRQVPAYAEGTHGKK